MHIRLDNIISDHIIVDYTNIHHSILLTCIQKICIFMYVYLYMYLYLYVYVIFAVPKIFGIYGPLHCCPLSASGIQGSGAGGRRVGVRLRMGRRNGKKCPQMILVIHMYIYIYICVNMFTNIHMYI